MENKFEWNDELVEEFIDFLKRPRGILRETSQQEIIDEFKKFKQPKPLLVVEGKELFEGDNYWGVDDEYRMWQISADENNSWKNTLKPFLTKESAERWLAEYKKTISYRELEEYADICKISNEYNFSGIKRHWINKEDLLNHFKPKQ